MDEVTLTIDGRTVTVPKGTLVLEAAKTLGIEIPVFCYHNKLESVGACRQCLVQIEGFPKPQVSCSTRVAEGMVVHTDTPEVKQMWESVLEFLLINHPLDCPVCDRGGESPLQDNTFNHGPTDSRFEHEKRHFEKPVPLSSLVLLDRERCIQCFRCVRFQREIPDHPQIQMFNRGYGDYIDIFPGRPFESNFSGNTIELCPVGALLSSVFRFRARPWEIKHTESVCPDCGVGCNINIDARNSRKVVRYLSRENLEVDDGWLCDRGRFDSTFINSPARLTKPLVRKDGKLVEATWEEALTTAVQAMKSAGARVAGLGSADRTNEQNYLFQKFMRLVLGTNNVDYTIEPRARGGTDAVAAGLCCGLFTGSIRDIVASDVTLSLGSDVSNYLPVIDLWIKKAVRKHGKKLVFAYPLHAELAGYSSVFLPYHYGKEADFAVGLSSAVTGEAVADAGGITGDQFRSTAKMLADAKSVAILVSRSMLESSERCDEIFGAIGLIADALKSRGATVSVMLLTEGANTQGAMDVGLLPGHYPGYRKIDAASTRDMSAFWGAQIPSEPGLTGRDMITAAGQGDIEALWLMGQDPAKHLLYGDEVGESFIRLNTLVVQDFFLTETAKMAHVVLPSCTFAETRGTFTNTERRVQRINKAIEVVSDSEPDTNIIMKAATFAGSNLGYGRTEDIFREIAAVVPGYHGMAFDSIGPKGRQWEVRG
jgi:NADH-quinone oxidoreductase chain G